MIRFMSHVERAPSGCLLWTGSLAHHGYGQFIVWRGGRWAPVRTHRWMWEQTYGPIPEGLRVLHRCDIRACVEPTHLFLGTVADNQADMKAKGRARSGTARLTVEQVAAIRASAEHVDILAARYGVSCWTVYDIRSGRTWRHL
jgi:hypothetical protein